MNEIVKDLLRKDYQPEDFAKLKNLIIARIEGTIL